jgi:hypothetical protein
MYLLLSTAAMDVVGRPTLIVGRTTRSAKAHVTHVVRAVSMAIPHATMRTARHRHRPIAIGASHAVARRRISKFTGRTM